jgi:2-methylcitrate dehydratase PrpD
VDGRAFLAAVAVGYEAAFRIGEAVNPSHYYFFHPTGTVATFGAAAAAGSLLHLTADQMANALGSAGTQAAALWEFNADGAMSKHLHPGKAAMNGIIAADLARVGFTGATRILEGERGFFRAMSTSFDASRITDGLGTRWKIGENGYKLYSCCGHTHTAVDCALEIRARRRWSKDDVLREVSAIAIETYGPGYEIVKEMNPRTPYQAKFSLAYCVATALLEGALGLEQFADDRFPSTALGAGGDGVRDRAIAELLGRVRVTVADDLTAKYPAAWPVRLSVSLSGGAAERAATDYPKGHPENPVSTAELEEKFTALVASRFGKPAAHAMLAALHSIEQCDDMSLLLAGAREPVGFAPHR